jgi:hypothetical protein
MGTRSAVIIFQDQKAKGYYNQYDGYPSGVGAEVLDEIKKIDEVENGWKQFADKFRNVKLIDENTKPSLEVQEKYKAAGFCNLNVSNQSSEDWYCLLRELQGGAYLPAIMSGALEHMVDGSNFVSDSLFCEYAYVIDLDKMVIEFYKGGQHKKQKGNRFGEKQSEGYFPVGKVGEIALTGISKDERAEEIMLAVYEKADK